MKCASCKQPKDTHIDEVLCPDTHADDIDLYRQCVSGACEEAYYFNTYHPEFPKYLNVYRVEQSYGGPEEGGWWFDTSEPLESIQVDNEEEAKQVQARLESRYAANPDDRERMRGRTSAAGGYDISIRCEYQFAQFYPQEQPRYE